MTGSPPITAHLSGVLLVVEDLLVAAAGAVLHVGQRPDPGLHLQPIRGEYCGHVTCCPPITAHLKLQLLVVDPNVAAASLVPEVLS